MNHSQQLNVKVEQVSHLQTKQGFFLVLATSIGTLFAKTLGKTT